uniref:Uncharacterized protein n=1 Tax=Oryza nivara TaxID=4536 RepID=A0A0E0HE18_ORYNI
MLQPAAATAPLVRAHRRPSARAAALTTPLPRRHLGSPVAAASRQSRRRRCRGKRAASPPPL